MRRTQTAHYTPESDAYFDAIVAALRGAILLTKQDKKEWAQRHGIEFLGAGMDRTVFGVPEGALKIDWRGDDNEREAHVWTHANERLRQSLVPVIATAPDYRWLLMERVSPLRAGREPRLLADGSVAWHYASDCGIGDTRPANISADGRLLDYSRVNWPGKLNDCAPGWQGWSQGRSRR